MLSSLEFIESLRLEKTTKTTKTIKSNHQPTPSMPTYRVAKAGKDQRGHPLQPPTHFQ